MAQLGHRVTTLAAILGGVQMDLDDEPGAVDWPPARAGYLSDDDVALVTVREAAQRVGVSESAVQDWRKRELIFPAGWEGRAALYSLHDVWATEHAVRTSGRGRPRQA